MVTADIEGNRNFMEDFLLCLDPDGAWSLSVANFCRWRLLVAAATILAFRPTTVAQDWIAKGVELEHLGCSVINKGAVGLGELGLAAFFPVRFRRF